VLSKQKLHAIERALVLFSILFSVACRQPDIVAPKTTSNPATVGTGAAPTTPSSADTSPLTPVADGLVVPTELPEAPKQADSSTESATGLATPPAAETVPPDCPRLDRALRTLVAADDAARFAETNGLDLVNGRVAISIALTGAVGDLAQQYALEDPVLFFPDTPKARMQARAGIEHLCDLSKDSRVVLVSAIPRIVNPAS
jgi:hypothetical protein